MARVAINAMSLRKGGGLQVMAGLLARFSTRNTFSVLWTDPQSLEGMQRIAGVRDHITYHNPLKGTRNASIFVWSMARQAAWLQQNAMDCVLGVNHHFPSGSVPQIIYHLNVLRFERQRRAIWQDGELADRLRDWRAQNALRKANANLFESNLLMDTAKRGSATICRPRVVYIGLDDTQALPDPVPPTGEDAYALIAVTSSAPHKDNATLIHMLAKLAEMKPEVPWKLRIAGGDGASSFTALQKLAEQLGVDGRIEYLGFLRHEDLAVFGAKSLCLVSTSLVESFCMVAVEAMSWGCPAVVAQASSMPESVGSAGLLARPSDPSDFAEQVIKLLDPNVRKKRVVAGLARAASVTWTAAASQFEEEIARSVAGIGL
jgi:glycosyltransferase involved in cell wall biosynthesis